MYEAESSEGYADPASPQFLPGFSSLGPLWVLEIRGINEVSSR